MRVLHVTPFYAPAPSFGGMARASSALCRALARRGHEVSVVTARLEPGDAREELVGGVRVRRVPVPGALARLLVPWAPGLLTCLRSEAAACDVAHVHGHRGAFAVAAAAALGAAGKPWVLAPHGTWPHHGQWRLAKALLDALVGKRTLALATALVAVSRAEARDLPRPAALIANGVEEPGPAPQPPPPQGASRRLLFVGNDRPQKRGQALPELLDALPGTELELVGPMGPRFLELFRRHQGGRVVARGVLAGPALAEAYARADALVHPAVGEAFGLVPFEAALAGTVGVVAGGHGCGEWFGAAGGCVVPPDDVPALAGALRARLNDRDLAHREREAVAAFARERLTWARAAAEHEALYTSLVQTRAGARS